ncbi:MAG: competence protein ComEC [Enterobacterales bacterium]|jgi:competence protein ComEC
MLQISHLEHRFDHHRLTSISTLQNLYPCAFLVGNCLIWYGTSVLHPAVYLLLMVCPFLLFNKYLKLLLFILLGCVYAEHTAYQQQWHFPESYVADNHIVVGSIEDLPEMRGNIRRIRFRVQSINHQLQPSKSPLFFRLACYRNCPDFKADQKWQLLVRLKPINGYANPQGFDYEKWLYSSKFKATGYIVTSKKNKLISEKKGVDSYRALIRDFFIEKIVNPINLDNHVKDNHVKDNSNQSAIRGSIIALAIGDRSFMDVEEQQLLAKNGLSHLMAISGLHIGLSAIPGFFFAGFLWRKIRLLQRFNRYSFQWLICLFPALCYTALSGFGLPALRSAVMLITFSVVQISRSSISVQSRFSIALGIILLLEPLAPLQISFWLSFMATAILLLLSRLHSFEYRLLALLKLQAQLFLLLMPLQLLIFDNLSLLAPLVNYFAIPFVSVILLPLILLLVAMILLSEVFLNIPGIDFITFIIVNLLNLFWSILKWLEPVSQAAQFSFSSFNLTFVLFYPLLFLVLVSIGWRLRLVILLIFMGLLQEVDKQDKYTLRMTVFDVGQGLALSIEYANKLLIYDTAYGSKDFSVSTMTLLPWLYTKHKQNISLLVVSHNDVDHSGGLSTLMNSKVIDELTVGPDVVIPETSKYTPRRLSHCQQGQAWQWQALSIEVLSPGRYNKLKEGNETSCVLLIKVNGKSLLLTGDIEEEAERQLLKNYPKLKTTILLMPHHGSKTSSTASFIKQLAPEVAVVSSGYLNRFNLPAKNIIKRYQNNAVKVFNTADSGALEITLDVQGRLTIKQWRLDNRNLWRRH